MFLSSTTRTAAMQVRMVLRLSQWRQDCGPGMSKRRTEIGDYAVAFEETNIQQDTNSEWFLPLSGFSVS